MQQAYDAVMQGEHLSSSIEHLFRDVQPSPLQATTLRFMLMDAIRYGDLAGAMIERPHPPEDFHLPDWLKERLQDSLADRYNAFLQASCADAPVFIRVNTLRTDPATCVRALAPYQPVIVGGLIVRVDRPYGMFSSNAFRQGWFEQQDITSQHVAESADVQPGMRVMDSCAGAGGKALALAAIMKNRGRIIALDTVASKLDACRTRASRAGADCIETRVITSTKTVKRLHGTADRVLIDAPCTGTGVLRRNPDITWHLTEDGFHELLATQQQILRLHARMAKPGGRVVYAACSVLHEEGRDQITALLAADPEFSLVETWSTLPGEHGGDGFFVAVLERSPQTTS